MFRFLVVEDDGATRDQVVKRLCEVFPDCEVEDEEAAHPAVGRVAKAAQNGLPFDAAILDFKLPSVRGANPEVDHEVCDAILERMPGTFVVHITAYESDSAVMKHILECHRDRYEPWGDYVTKSESAWPRKLVKTLKAHLYGKPISERLEQLFGGRVCVGGSSSRNAPICRRGSATHELALLSREIEAHWEDLDERLQDRIRAHFFVNADVTPLRVSLMRDAGLGARGAQEESC